MTNIHDIIIEGLAKELGLICEEKAYCTHQWISPSNPCVWVVVKIENGKFIIRNYGTNPDWEYDLNDPNLIDQIKTRLTNDISGAFLPPSTQCLQEYQKTTIQTRHD